MAKPIAVLDVDDTLLDWCSGFLAFVERETGHRKTSSFADHDFAFEGWFDTLSPADLGALAARFNHSPDFGALPHHDGAADLLQRLRAEGIDCVAVTACGDEAPVLAARRAQLADMGIERTVILPRRAKKADVFRELVPLVVVDDAVHHVATAVALGIPAILPEIPLNLRARLTGAVPPETIVVGSLQEAGDRILGLLNPSPEGPSWPTTTSSP